MTEEAEYKKAVLVICDGLADRGTSTPLSEAETPNMDRLAGDGICGLMHSISPGIVPGSDTAHLAILGGDPYEDYPGRGPFEALGAGIELKEGDVAFRANFATIDNNWEILDRRAGRFGSDELAEALNIKIDGVRFIVKHTTEHRCALVMRGKGLSGAISDVDPHDMGKVLKSGPLEDTDESRRTAKLLNEFVRRSHDILSEFQTPANVLLTRGAGEFRQVMSIKDAFGFDGFCVAGSALYKGVAKYLGMDVIEVEGATGRADTDLGAKADALLSHIEDYDLGFVHIKATDSKGHDGDWKGKKEFIERIDREFIARIIDIDAYIILTADHSTPVSIRRHSSDPVPVLMHGEGVRTDQVKAFNELTCAQGGLGAIHGVDLMPIIADYMGYYRMYGV
ncbi:MAG: 2,3-bisphosphoglycerate-independent phosphoglycerate mutase [Candidatus Syntrophoarchaeum caldarius]|uniref:2,3-bisphosphoglycerate-independent phosphoglycerate mutase n=1 Tax=Candidatus Syntropharchaeum caldarium TaxID=1838285 RepID=A0A1F2PBG1_9EURY|nr:MAG: 2,3-bisphosphoglycerate-independent phosphoglycerate mutase [Candidatus Syntrophoarchaeum caldarius]